MWVLIAREYNESPVLLTLLPATTWPFQGVGLYFDWNYKRPMTKVSFPPIGLHLDWWSGSTPGQRPLSWLRIGGFYYYQSVVDETYYCKTNREPYPLMRH